MVNGWLGICEVRSRVAEAGAGSHLTGVSSWRKPGPITTGSRDYRDSRLSMRVKPLPEVMGPLSSQTKCNTSSRGVAMGRTYGQLSLDDRCEIARLSANGSSIRQIAAALDRSPSTISRELKRNRGVQVGYKPGYAEQQTRARRWKGSRLEHDAGLRGTVLAGLSRGWSPSRSPAGSRANGGAR